MITFQKANEWSSEQNARKRNHEQKLPTNIAEEEEKDTYTRSNSRLCMYREKREEISENATEWKESDSHEVPHVDKNRIIRQK